MARILIVTPAPPRSRVGNRVTATRWARLLRGLGHHVELATELGNRRPDALIALHARKSANAISAFAKQFPDRLLIVALTGTDLYHDLPKSKATMESVQLASSLVVLQPRAIDELPEEARSKTRVIFQSSLPLKAAPKPLSSAFEVCVSGHLRAVKDPLRAARAARLLPSTSRVRVTHLGAALTPSFERQAKAEVARNPRYVWLGEVPSWRARQILARSQLLVHTSKLEGGANVISEAIVANVPVISSEIAGSIGLLGDDYPGYFETGNTKQLAELLRRCERDTSFLKSLRRHCQQLAPRFTPKAEQSAWKTLLPKFSVKNGS